MTWVLTFLIVAWILAGAAAYFHRVFDDKRRFPKTPSRTFFLLDDFFYDSLLNGFRAFYFEFL